MNTTIKVPGATLVKQLGEKVAFLRDHYEAVRVKWEEEHKGEAEHIWAEWQARCEREEKELLEKYRYGKFGKLRTDDEARKAAIEAFDIPPLSCRSPYVPRPPRGPAWLPDALRYVTSATLFPDAEFEIGVAMINAVVDDYERVKS